MAKKITYLFGAGASYNAVPILNSLSTQMKDVANELKFEVESPMVQRNNKRRILRDINLEQYSKEISKFAQDLIFLANKSDEYGTIDTYAKKLEINHEYDELKKLKFLVSIFFTIWQGYFSVKKDLDLEKKIKYSKVDSRYKSLISNYLIKTSSSDPILDANVNFLSWNYDFQLENSLSLFFKNSHCISDINGYIKFLPDSNNVFSNNRILHLNGISNYWINNSDQIERVFQNDDEKDITSLIQRISQLYKPSNYHKCTSLINYAWDNNDSKIEEAKRIFNETDILVIIGYSFPTFNRAIDSRLLSGKSNSFDKIIYQDPNASKELLELFNIQFRNKVGNLVKESGQLQVLKKTEQFYIPPEYFPRGEKKENYYMGITT